MMTEAGTRRAHGDSEKDRGMPSPILGVAEEVRGKMESISEAASDEYGTCRGASNTLSLTCKGWRGGS